MALLFANNNSLSAITTKPSGLSGGSMNLISTQTASGSSTISFTSGIDSTYDSYVFKFYDIHPATNNVGLSFNFSVDSGSNYNVAKTTTTFRAYHDESDSEAALEYDLGQDLAQGTGFQRILRFIGNGNDECGSGEMFLFSPSSTTFVKHFIATGNTYWGDGDYSMNDFTAGYGNTTSAVDAVQFKMSSGNIDSGVIKLYGVS
jgi:hypothetical protein